MQKIKKLDALTSLRFVAAGMIVLGHLPLVFGSLGIPFPAPPAQGVSFFFVLSGFILAYNYPGLATRTEIRHFWLARFARVWPLHAFTCLLWIWLILQFDRERYFPGIEGIGKLLANVFLLQAWVPYRDWSLAFNGVSWSLSTEFFFYACFPFLINRWRSTWHWLLLGQALIAGTIILLGDLYELPYQDEFDGIGLLGVIYFNPLVRIIEFSIGIAVAHVIRHPAIVGNSLSVAQWFVLELAAVLGVVMSLLASSNFSGIWSVLGISVGYYFSREGLWLFWAILIGITARSQGPLTRLLSTRFPVFLGEISFALYLCHSLIITYLMPYADRIRTFGLTGYFFYWGFCLLFSSLLFIGVETPARRLILAWGEGKTALLSFKSVATTRVIAALGFLVVIGIGMSSFQPSFIWPLNDEARDSFLRSANVKLIKREATFDGRYTILAVRESAVPDGKIAVEVLIQAKTTLVANDILALHLNNERGEIIGAPADLVLDKSGKEVTAGTRWIQRFSFPPGVIEQARSLGLAMYSRVGAQGFDVKGGHSDWGGKRLIVMRSDPAQPSSRTDVLESPLLASIPEQIQNIPFELGGECGVDLVNYQRHGEFIHIGRPSGLVIEGWALDRKQGDVPSVVVLQLASGEARYHAMLKRKGNREDLAKAFAKEEYADAGFASEIDVATLPIGQYDVNIILSNGEKNLVCPTYRKLKLSD